MLSIMTLNKNAECHCADAECPCAECRYAECLYAVCHYAERQNADCCYAECCVRLYSPETFFPVPRVRIFGDRDIFVKSSSTVQVTTL
jgi:hypothetical protein